MKNFARAQPIKYPFLFLEFEDLDTYLELPEKEQEIARQRAKFIAAGFAHDKEEFEELLEKQYPHIEYNENQLIVLTFSVDEYNHFIDYLARDWTVEVV